MSIARISILVLMAMLTAEVGAQLPDDLSAAMRARDIAFYAADSEQWEMYTASDYTTVQQDGSFLTRESDSSPCASRRRGPTSRALESRMNSEATLSSLDSLAAASGY